MTIMMMMMIMTDPFTTNLVVKGPVVKGSVAKGATSLLIIIIIITFIIINQFSHWQIYPLLLLITWLLL